MKYIDIVVQSALFLYAMGVVAIASVQPEIGFHILIPQMLLGPWQLMGSLASILLKTKHYKLKIPHQVLSWFVILLLYGATSHGVAPIPNFLLLFGAPWALAIYYYIVSWKVLIAKQPKGKFLPHLSF